MSQENVEIVRRVYEASLHGETERVIEMSDPDIRIDMSGRVFNPAVYEGHEGSRRFFAEIDEVWDDFRLEPLEFIDAGDTVVASHLVRGRGKGSGVEVELPSTNVYTLRDGLVTEVHMYRDRTQALEAAGLRE